MLGCLNDHAGRMKRAASQPSPPSDQNGRVSLHYVCRNLTRWHTLHVVYNYTMSDATVPGEQHDTAFHTTLCVMQPYPASHTTRRVTPHYLTYKRTRRATLHGMSHYTMCDVTIHLEPQLKACHFRLCI